MLGVPPIFLANNNENDTKRKKKRKVHFAVNREITRQKKEENSKSRNKKVIQKMRPFHLVTGDCPMLSAKLPWQLLLLYYQGLITTCHPIYDSRTTLLLYYQWTKIYRIISSSSFITIFETICLNVSHFHTATRRTIEANLQKARSHSNNNNCLRF